VTYLVTSLKLAKFSVTERTAGIKLWLLELMSAVSSQLVILTGMAPMAMAPQHDTVPATIPGILPGF